MFHRRTMLLLLSLNLAACGLGDPSFVRIGDYECDASEAILRQVLPTIPHVDPKVPQEFALMTALDLRPASMDFVRRFADTKLAFVSGEVLRDEPDLHFPINPRSGMSPFIVQVAVLRHPTPDQWEAEIGWSYKKTYQKSLYTATKTATGWTVVLVKKLDGNLD
jgi:hypothetical protein